MRLVLAALASLVLAQPAAAGTVTARYQPGDSRTTGDETLIRFTAADGEANRLTIHSDAAGVRFLDEVPLAAGEGCDQVGEREAFCHQHARATVRVDARLGDADDRATAAARGVGVHGGPGADTLVGGPSGDRLDGGPGADSLAGGDGDDVLEVASGDAGEAAERLDGGSGTDILSFGSARAPASADLAAASGRLGGQALTLAGLEELEGGPRDDRLLGGPEGDRIYGFDGDDVVDGRSGDDRVTGGGGRDTVRGGPGDDVLEQYDEAPYPGDDYTPDNRFDCGSGRDRIEELNDRDSVGTSCEILEAFRLLADPRRRAAAHLALPRSNCSAGARCRETLRLDTVRGKRARPRTRLETIRYDGRRAKRSRRVRLDRDARATLRRQRPRHLLVRLDGPDLTDPIVFMIRLGS